MEKNKAIFLDRDGTINYDYGYVYKPSDLKIIDGVIEALKKLQSKGYLLIIITNQSGIAKGLFTEEEYYIFTKKLKDELLENGIKIDDIFYCPHDDSDNCECRKPKTKLFEMAIKKYNIELNNSFAIGDKERDLSICDKTNIKGILIGESKKYKSVKNLLEAAEYIIKKDGEEKNENINYNCLL